MITGTIAELEDRIIARLCSDTFLNTEGLANEVPFFIYPYDPQDDAEIKRSAGRMVDNLAKRGVTVQRINLYDLSVQMLEERGAWARLLEAETSRTKDAILGVLQNMLDPQQHLAPRIGQEIAQQDAHQRADIIFLEGIGEVFPYVRSHNVLNNLQSVISDRPLLVFFPGEYAYSVTMGSSLELFDRLKDDQYYRAQDIRVEGI